MARTIGKIKIRKLQAIAREEALKGPGAHERAESRVPPEYFEIWESGWAEIRRIIDDEVFKVINGRIQ